MTKVPLIEIKNLTKEYYGDIILKGIDLTIHENEFVTLLGPSGCGKTTLLRIIGGFDTPTSGEVNFNCKDLIQIPSYKREINTVFQKYALFPHLNVFDNIAFGLRMKKVPEAEVTLRVHFYRRTYNSWTVFYLLPSYLLFFLRISSIIPYSRASCEVIQKSRSPSA